MGLGLLEEHEGLGGDVFDDVVGLLVDEVLLEHVDLVVPEHAPLGYFAESLHLGGKALVLVDLLHEAGVLLGLGGVDAFGPTSLPVEHSLLASAHASGVDLVHRKVGDVVELDEVGVPQHVVLVLEVVLGSRVEGSPDRRSVLELGRASELPPRPGVLVKLCHIFITYPFESPSAPTLFESGSQQDMQD